MPNEGRIHSAIPVKLLLKREDNEGLVHVLAQQLHAPLPPGPELWTHVINDRNAALTHLPRHAPVEGRRVDNDGDVRMPLVGGANQFLVERENFRKMAEDFGNSDHSEILGVDDDIAPGSPHALSSRPKKAGRGVALITRSGPQGSRRLRRRSERSRKLRA